MIDQTRTTMHMLTTYLRQEGGKRTCHEMSLFTNFGSFDVFASNTLTDSNTVKRVLGTKNITIDSHSLETCLAVVLQWFIRNYPPSRTQFLVEFVLQYQQSSTKTQ